MLQMNNAARAAQEALEIRKLFPPAWESMGQLRRAVDAWMADWLAERSRQARDQGLAARAEDALDRRIRTDLPEHTDNPAVSDARKLRIVRSLHRTNIALGVYRNYADVLLPVLKKTAERLGREVKVLELASGSGGMAMHLARTCARRNLPVSVTGSDYVPQVVDGANERALQKGNPARFRLVNAFAMDALSDGEYDVIYITGTMHHFSPGSLAVIMAQSRRVATSHFIGLDGLRSLGLLLFLPAVHVLTLLPDHVHDAWLTARKFYSLFELGLIARMALPGVPVSARHSFPDVSVLTADFRA
ncbi:MAG: class I SAM-dependent methyltransferase [Thermodesulfobacteriota bacterium]